MTRPVSSKEAAEMRAMHDAGASQRAIAQRTGRSRHTVSRCLDSAWSPRQGVRPADVAEMMRLAAQGLGRADIAACTGRSVQTVRRYVGHVVPRRDINRPPDLARYRRMIAAAESAEYGTSHELAARFRLKNPRTWWVTLVRARRIVAGANKQEAA